MAAVWKHDVIPTSYDVINSCCGSQKKHFGCTISPLRFVVIALIFSELMEEGEVEFAPHRVPEGKQGLSPVIGLRALLASCTVHLRISLNDAFDFSLFNFP